jgi:hypothetical protein
MNALRPQQLTVLGTSQCSAKCAHCSMNSTPRRRDKLSFEQIRSAIDQLHERQALQVVIFAGGEPTFLGEALLDAIAHAESRGIGTRIVTNAFWATTSAKAEAMITDLRQAGLRELNISADDYHLPFIPFDNVVRAWQAAKGRGFGAVVIANCAGPQTTLTAQEIMRRLGESLPVRFDDAGQSAPLPEVSSDGTLYMISNSYLQRLGRARGVIGVADLFFPSQEDALAGGCPWAVRSAALSPKNHLVACCGIEAEGNPILDFGDAGKQSVDTLVNEADQDIVVNAIARLGPVFLKRFIQQREPAVTFRRRYASMCEVCEDVVSRPEARAALGRHLEALTAHVICARLGSERPRTEGANVERTETIL